MKNIKTFIIIAIAITCICCIFAFHKEQPINKIAFLGDSITAYGWEKENGYVLKVVQYLKDSGLNFEPVPAGVCGDSTKDMLDRIDADVLDKNPDVVFFMGGINDVWFHLCTFEEFKNNIEAIIKKTEQKGSKLIIISITVLTEDINNPENQKIDEFNSFLKEITEQKKIQYIDANTVFKKELKKYDNPENVLTVDGVHLNEKGNELLAQTITKEFLKKYKFRLSDKFQLL